MCLLLGAVIRKKLFSRKKNTNYRELQYQPIIESKSPNRPVLTGLGPILLGPK
jgi:hypothetical protein